MSTPKKTMEEQLEEVREQIRRDNEKIAAFKAQLAALPPGTKIPCSPWLLTVLGRFQEIAPKTNRQTN